jgi:cysteinyl-tRNA synthetase
MRNNEGMIRFFNTMSAKLEPFRPLIKGKVKLYTCGPTVYDYAHIGNFRAYMFEDLLKRFLVYRGFEVTHIMNITDVEDKIIREATVRGISLREYTESFTEAFFQDIDTLNIIRADVYPRATEHIAEMAEMVKTLAEKGFAYEKDGSWYFDISRFPRYGRLSKIKMNERRAGVRIDADEYAKESVHDFALWKAHRKGNFYWDTELGPGRPGWHIECSAMSHKYLGETFDIHCGGVDNIFPHHENEIAQSESFSGKNFVNTWLHCQHLVRDGQKMSKSLGNTLSLRELMGEHGADPMAIRLLLLSTHYRKMLNFTFEALRQAEAALQRIHAFLIELETRTFPEGDHGRIDKMAHRADQDFIAGLSDDLNISTSLSALFGLIKQANVLLAQDSVSRSGAERLKDTLRSWDRVLGVLPPQDERILPDDIMRKIKEREEARAAKNYDHADRIRDELLARGIVLEDTKEGVRWKRVREDSTGD